MLNFATLPSVIETTNPELLKHVQTAPKSVHILFAGQDSSLSDLLRDIFGVPLPGLELIVSYGITTGSFILMISGDDDVAILLALKPAGGAYDVQTCVLTDPQTAARTSARVSGVSPADYEDRIAAAFDDFVFRRLVPPEGRVS